MLFSKRYRDKFASGDLKPSLPVRHRNRLFYGLSKFNDFDGWGLSPFREAEQHFKEQLGEELVSVRNASTKEWEPTDFEGLIKKGFPEQVFDMIEAFLAVLGTEQRAGCQEALNSILREESQPWALVNEFFVELDSEWLTDMVIGQAHSLLAVIGFKGPLNEFEEALKAHSAGEERNTVTYASSALESTMKAVLNVNTARPGKLVKDLIDSGLVPAYQQGFLESFKDILEAPLIERHQPARAHGQGTDVIEVESSFAELCLHLTASLIVFLIKRHMEKTQLAATQAAEDLPF